MLVDALVRRAAERTPDAEALVCGSTRLTYGQLEDATGRVAAGLAGLGVSRGDRVAIHLENGVDAVLSIFGALRAGAVFVPVNPTTKAEKLGYILRDSGAAALVSDQRAAKLVADALASARGISAVVLAGAPDDPPEYPFTPFADLIGAGGGPAGSANIDRDLAALVYTSGSTGMPKGVMLSHANILSATTSINAYLGNRPDDVILDVLPLSFDYGLYQLFLACQSGARIVLEKSFAYASHALDLMVRERVTALPLVPTIAALLVRHDLATYDLSALRYITNTGAVLPAAHIAALRAKLPQVRIFSMYGLTECKRVSYLDPQEIDTRPTSVGKAMSNCEVYLVDEAGRRVDHGVGRLVVRGSNVMQGYWRAPEETARVLRPGVVQGERVLYTDDIFRIDADGFMYFVSRTDDVIKSRGQKVSPSEIERVLYDLPGVSEALVVGVPDPIMGEAIKAFVALHEGAHLTEQEVLLHCSKQLEDYMVPREVAVVAALPRTSTGKLSRRALQSAAVS